MVYFLNFESTVYKISSMCESIKNKDGKFNIKTYNKEEIYLGITENEIIFGDYSDSIKFEYKKYKFLNYGGSNWFIIFRISS